MFMMLFLSKVKANITWYTRELLTQHFTRRQLCIPNSSAIVGVSMAVSGICQRRNRRGTAPLKTNHVVTATTRRSFTRINPPELFNDFSFCIYVISPLHLHWNGEESYIAIGIKKANASTDIDVVINIGLGIHL